jgi:RNA polymerase sigma-70 factor (ECF subfamily)
LSTQYQYSDSILLQALKNGDEEAFELLFKKYSGRIYYVAFQYINDRDEAEEIVQEVFYRVWIHQKDLRSDLPFPPYLVRIAKNLIINKSKRKIVERAYLNSLTSDAADQETENTVQFSEIKSILDELIEKLPEKRKEVFLMSRSKGLTNREIAHHLNISESTVENHINKALKMLRQGLTEAGYLASVIAFSNFLLP